MDEKKSYSFSRMRCGHYKVHTRSTLIADIKCFLVNLAVRNGFSLDIWLRGVLVMFEKFLENVNVEKYDQCSYLKPTLTHFIK